LAKLKAPLMSLGASGALGKALVFFGWKGLDVVREYVIPANPKTTAQNTQRGYLTAAVAMIHYCQSSAVPLAEADIMAYALWGSTLPTPRTWFNQAVKNWVDQKVAEKTPAIYFAGLITPGSEKLTFRCFYAPEAGVATDGAIFYGTSKTALINSIAATPAEMEAGKEIPNLKKGVKYFCQYRPNAPDAFVGAMSGIYYGVPLA